MPDKEAFCLTCGAAPGPDCHRGRHSIEVLDNRPHLVNEEVEASALVSRYGDKLVGRGVDTPAWPGGYPGGVATVIELEPDPGAPEIVFQVMHPEHGEVGVFGYEIVRLLPKEE